MSQAKTDAKMRAALLSIYEEIMWLSARPNVTAGRARGWYTHIMAESVKRQIRRFSGKVSRAAVEDLSAELRLEHFKRIQTTLTSLVERHRAQSIRNAEEFVSIVLEYEQVHIVTREENYAAMRAKGDYMEAGIELLPWAKVSKERRQQLWEKMLRGKVVNAAEYEL